MAKVSVIIPLYNHALYVAQAVESVLGQTLSDLELIVVNDGSTDNSREILHGFHDPRLRVIDQANQGAHAAINRGLAEARGDFLAILNSDDLFIPTRLETLIPVLEVHPEVGLAASYIEIIDHNGKTLGVKHGYKDMSPWVLNDEERSFRAGNDLRAALLTENYLATTSNYVFSRTWLERVGYFRPLQFAHDWDFALRTASQAEVFLSPELLMQYRVHATNTIRQNQAAMIFEVCWILAVHLPQHVNTSWFTTQEAALWERLIHSLYTFGCDRVLVLLLLQRLSENPALAESLLNPKHPQRAQYQAWITATLAKDKPALSEEARQGVRTWLRKLKR